jgi:hypothetical protein
MQTSSLDVLEKSDLPPAQARAILKVMETEMTAAHEVLATRADLADLKMMLAELRADLRVEIRQVEGRLTRWVFTCILGQTAVLAGLLYFVAGHPR